MINYAIVAGSYKQAVNCIKFYNLARETCIVITGEYIFRKCRNEIKNMQIIFGEDAPKNSAFDCMYTELAQRLCPELRDGVLSVQSHPKIS